jgi:poly-gamma-glutamate synthesis protein (capsule biosynthesis protein)
VPARSGDEYVDAPREDVRAIALAAIEAGADAFLGHHPHVLRRAALVRGKPVFYSLGNLLMRMKTGKPWTEYGALTRLTLAKSGAATIELCPYRIFGLDPVLLASDPRRQVHESPLSRHVRSTVGSRFIRGRRNRGRARPGRRRRMRPADAAVNRASPEGDVATGE